MTIDADIRFMTSQQVGDFHEHIIPLLPLLALAPRAIFILPAGVFPDVSAVCGRPAYHGDVPVAMLAVQP